MGYVRALRVLHRGFSRYPVRHRVHILIRFLTCPFLRILDDVPLGARLLEIGAGHSLFGRLVVEDRAREVVAVEPDLRKGLLPSPSPQVRKVAGYDACVRGTFDAVVMIDVAYRMPPQVRHAIFSHVFALLPPGGLFLLKEMDVGHPWKMRWARVQEVLSDTFLKQTLGEGFFAQSTAMLESMLTGIGFTGFTARPIDRGYPHPHIVYTAVKPSKPPC